MYKVLSSLFTMLLFCQLSYGQDIINVGCDYDYPPYSFIDEQGNKVGFDVDIINAIAAIYNIQVNFIFDEWDSTMLRLEKGEIDIISGIVYSENRENIYDFSFPLHTEYYAIFARKETEIEDVRNLKGLKSAFLPGDISNESFLKPMGLTNNYLKINSLPEAIQKVDAGECDYVVAPYPLGMQIVKKNNFNSIEVKGPPIIPSVYCLAVTQGNVKLLAQLNNGIEALMRNGELDKIYNKWIKYKRKDDKYRQFFQLALIVIAGLGLVTFILLISWNLLRKKVSVSSMKIKDAERIYREIFNSVGDALIILNEKGIIIEVNKKATEIYSKSSKEMVGCHASMILGFNETNIFAKIENYISNNKIFKKEMINTINNDVNLYLKIKGQNLELHHAAIYLLVISDITKEQKSIKKLEEAKIEAESANKTKSTFLATISHEIRTPLNAVIGFTNLLGLTNLDFQQRNYNNNIKLSSELLLSLVNDILDFTKIEAGKLELENIAFNLRELIHKLIEVQQIKAKIKKVDLELNLSDDVPEFVYGDQLRLTQIILNLLNNAIKFTDKGDVMLIVGRTKEKEKNSENRCRLWFIIKDTGAGIATEKLHQLFTPFVQANTSDSRKFGGTGLGLAIARNLVKLMDGEMFIESKVDEGTRISFFVNFKEISDTDCIDSVVELDTTTNIKLNDLNILVVDDNSFNAEIYSEQLSSIGAKVVWAPSGKAAIDKMVDDVYDVVLMDIAMPEMDGIETTQIIKRYKRWEQIPIIALSAYALADEKEKALNVGMVTYLSKPVSLAMLASTIFKFTRDNSDSTIISIDDYFEEGLNNFGGNHQLYNRALARFYQTHISLPQKMSELIKNNSYNDIKTIVHNIKNSAGTIGAKQLSTLAGLIDLKMKNNEDFSLLNLPEFIDELKNTLILLKKN